MASLELHFMWWNVTGASVTPVVAYSVGHNRELPNQQAIAKHVLTGSEIV